MSILFFIEDPGAAGFISDFLIELKKTKLTFYVLAKNHAVKILKNKKISFIEANSEGLKDFISEKNIRLFIFGTSQNPKSLGLTLLDYAKKENITSVAFIDSSADSDLRFKGVSNTSLNHKPDWLIVPDENTKKIFIKLGFNENKIVITGNPNYALMSSIKKNLDSHNLEVLREKVFKKKIKKPIIIFVDEHSNNADSRLYKSEEYNFFGRENLSNRNEVIAAEVLNILNSIQITSFFVVRLHPKSDNSDYESIASEIDSFNSDHNQYELIYCADLVIGMTSTLLMEAFLLGKEVISIIPKPDEIMWAPPGHLNNLNCVYSKKALASSIDKVLIKKTSLQTKQVFIENSPNEDILKFIMTIY